MKANSTGPLIIECLKRPYALTNFTLYWRFYWHLRDSSMCTVQRFHGLLIVLNMLFINMRRQVLSFKQWNSKLDGFFEPYRKDA